LWIFKTKAIVLKIEKKIDKDFIYTIFSYDYGKIKIRKKLSKTEKILDLWYIINFEIEVKKDIDIHKIRSIKIKSEFLDKNKTFDEINTYLILLAKIEKNMSFWIINKEVFDLIEIVNKYENINEEKLILASLKLKNILWEMAITNINIDISKILKFVQNSEIEKILKLKWIDEKMNLELKKLI